jgi:uncharacterized protein affecting Mg2+/Co2+ transport
MIFRNLMRISKSMKNPIYFQQLPSASEFQRAEGGVPSSMHEFVKWVNCRNDEESEFTPVPSRIMDALTLSGRGDDRLMNKEEVRAAIRYAFRKTYPEEDAEESGFYAMKELFEQIKLSHVTSVCMGPEKIRTICSAIYEKEKINPHAGNLFYYRITIENHSDHDIKVDGRSWRFEGDENNEVFEIPKFHPGLIGLTPTIKPRTSFHYMSNTKIYSKTGHMQGSLQVQNLADKTTFEVDIAKCPLISEST